MYSQKLIRKLVKGIVSMFRHIFVLKNEQQKSIFRIIVVTIVSKTSVSHVDRHLCKLPFDVTTKLMLLYTCFKMDERGQEIQSVS